MLKSKTILSVMQFVHKRSYVIPALIGIAIVFTSCIEEYTPKITESTELLVIDGSIVKGDSLQTVNISQSTAVDDNYFNALSGCAVWATNGQGMEFTFEEGDDGEYNAIISNEYLAYGSEFKVSIITPDGNEYESDYETIYESSEIDSLYYLEEDYQSSSISSDLGLQFYIDLKAGESATKNYRWVLEETWETHTLYPKMFSYSSNEMSYTITELGGSYDSLSVCYKTEASPDVYIASTENLTVNEKKKIPLVYYAETSYKLNYNYSVLVKQYALTDMAYVYWNKVMAASTESGGMYQTQSSSTVSNICNINDPDEVVLGFFWASSCTEKRINFSGPLTEFHDGHACGLAELDLSEAYPPANPYEPTYLVNLGTESSPAYWYAAPMCFDCTLVDGTTTKPDFFD
jgi:hypothetical protein